MQTGAAAFGNPPLIMMSRSRGYTASASMMGMFIILIHLLTTDAILLAPPVVDELRCNTTT